MSIYDFLTDYSGWDDYSEIGLADKWRGLCEWGMENDFDFTEEDIECFAEIVNETAKHYMPSLNEDLVERKYMYHIGPIFHFAFFPIGGNDLFMKCRYIANKLLNGLVNPKFDWQYDIFPLLPIDTKKVMEVDETEPIYGAFM